MPDKKDGATMERERTSSKAPAREEAGGSQRAELATGRPAGTAISAWNATPFAMMRKFAEEMDHMFSEIGLRHGLHAPRLISRGHELLKREAGLIPAEWSPQIEVFERGGQLVVRADLPGLTKDDVTVEVTDEVLTIRGERRQEKEEKGKGYFINECQYGSFIRMLPLPEGVEGSKAAATFKNGVLEITMPAPHVKESRPKRLEIKE